MATRKIKPFLLVVVDRDQGVFTVEGPITDDIPWVHAVMAAQKVGRQVTCSTPGEGKTKEMVAHSYKSEFGYRRVATGSIVSPKSN